MKVNKKLLDSVDVGGKYCVIICCAVYLNTKKEVGTTIHEQVAWLTLKGKDVSTIVRETGFEEKTVCGALHDITAFCGALEA